MLNQQDELNHEAAPITEEQEAVSGLLSMLLEQWDDELPLECEDADGAPEQVQAAEPGQKQDGTCQRDQGAVETRGVRGSPRLFRHTLLRHSAHRH